MKNILKVFLFIILILSMLFASDKQDINFNDIHTLFDTLNFSKDTGEELNYWTLISAFTNIIKDNNNSIFSSPSKGIMYYSPLYGYDVKQMRTLFQKNTVLSKKAINIVYDNLKKFIHRGISLNYISKARITELLDNLIRTCVSIDFNADLKDTNNITLFTNPKYEKEWSYAQKFLFRCGKEVTGLISDGAKNLKGFVNSIERTNVKELEYSFNDFETLCLFLGQRISKIDNESYLYYSQIGESLFKLPQIMYIIDYCMSYLKENNQNIYVYMPIYDTELKSKLRTFFNDNPILLEKAINVTYDTTKNFILHKIKTNSFDKALFIKLLDTSIKELSSIDFNAKTINMGNYFLTYNEFEKQEYRNWSLLKKFFFRSGSKFTLLVLNKLQMLKNEL